MFVRLILVLCLHVRINAFFVNNFALVDLSVVITFYRKGRIVVNHSCMFWI